ncbi:hypothetical protein GCM10017752_20190 [Streptomyces roseoviridis]
MGTPQHRRGLRTALPGPLEDGLGRLEGLGEGFQPAPALGQRLLQRSQHPACGDRRSDGGEEARFPDRGLQEAELRRAVDGRVGRCPARGDGALVAPESRPAQTWPTWRAITTCLQHLPPCVIMRCAYMLGQGVVAATFRRKR